MDWARILAYVTGLVDQAPLVIGCRQSPGATSHIRRDDHRSSSRRFSRNVAQLQRFDGRAWATMVRGDYLGKCRIAVVQAATCSPERPVHAPPPLSCRRDASDRAASCAARVCVHERSHKWHEFRWFPALCGSRRPNPFFVLRRVGPKRGRLVRSKFNPSKRPPCAGWNQSGGHISQLVLPDIAPSINTARALSACRLRGISLRKASA
jgi:hypothetical protein